MLSQRFLQTACGVLLLLAVRCSCQGIRTGSLHPIRTGDVAFFKLDITLAFGSPACGTPRPIILINGMFQPTMHANVNDTIKIQVNNKLPKNMPAVASGISIHFHGFYMWNEAAWADGVAFVTQCPVMPGDTYTYSFLADNPPGTYFFHDHNGMQRGNGLQGALVLGMPKTEPPIVVPHFSYGEYVMFISDWYNQEANSMAMQLNRPMDTKRQTNDTGSFKWVGNADAMLINGKGNQFDCNVNKTTSSLKSPYDPPVCNVTTFTIPVTHTGGGCTHEQFTVEAGKHYLFRLINAGTSQFITVCFEGHTVSLTAGDTTPMDDPVISSGCVDLASGQRYDVNLTANQKPGLYWISVHTQHAIAAPSAYAVLRYAGAAPSHQLLPKTPTPQGTVLPWDSDTQALVVASDFILGYADNYDDAPYWNLFNHGGNYDNAILYYNVQADKKVIFNMTQPLLGNGMLRWAINNVAQPSSPPCSCVMDSIKKDPQWLAKNAAPTDTKTQQALSNALLQVATVPADTNKTKYAVYNQEHVPVVPVAGMHIIELKHNWVVDVVINNLPASANNGDYRGINRTTSTPHPIHLHGHKFWVLGTGLGIFNESIYASSLNLAAPMLRDTAVLPEGGWLYLRFRANNPGMWPLHCHIMWHAYMGQTVYFAESVDLVPNRTQPGPNCPKQCINSFAPFTKSWLRKQYANSPYQVPDN